jgi:hypothetical protein
MRRRVLAISLPVATLLLAASAGSVSAECFPQPDPFPRMHYAFTATVTELSARVADALPETANFDWHVELDVDHNYRGHVPDRLEANGWDEGCDFTGVRVQDGDRLFVAAEQVDIGDPRLITRTVLLWRSIAGGRWEFYGAALPDGGLSYPTAAVRAHTTAEILAAIRGSRPPDTSTEALKREWGRGGDMYMPLLGTVLISVVMGMLIRLARRRSAPLGTGD